MKNLFYVNQHPILPQTVMRAKKVIFLKSKEKRRKQKEKPNLRQTQVTKLPNLKQM
jgi:hypothetical protein